MENDNLYTPITKLNQKIHNNDIYIKRDDLLPFSFGGNKVRIANEYFLDLFNKKCNCIISYGSTKSNMNRAVANYSKMYSIPCSIIYSDNVNKQTTFNYKLINTLGVETFSSFNEYLPDVVQNIIDRYLKIGFNPYYIYGNKFGEGHEEVSTKAYEKAYNEIISYEKIHNINFDYIFLASGTGATQAGLIKGSIQNNDSKKIVGISIARNKEIGIHKLKLFLTSIIKDNSSEIFDKINFIDKYNCNGYGKFNNEIIQLVKSILKNEGIVLDTTYTGKAFWGMSKYFIENKIDNSKVLFLHTGGTPLFVDDILSNSLL